MELSWVDISEQMSEPNMRLTKSDPAGPDVIHPFSTDSEVSERTRNPGNPETRRDIPTAKKSKREERRQSSKKWYF